MSFITDLTESFPKLKGSRGYGDQDIFSRFHCELAVAAPIVGVAFPSLLPCIFEVYITNIDLLGHLEDSGGVLEYF